MPLESVRLVHSDTDTVERGTGTVGSRSMQHGGSAVHQAAQQVRHKARDLASHLLEADPEDIVFVGGMVGVAGGPGRSLSWTSLAAGATHGKRGPEGGKAGPAAATGFAWGWGRPLRGAC